MDILKDEKIYAAVEDIRLDYSFHADKLFSKFKECEKSLKDLSQFFDDSWKKFFNPLYQIVSFGVWSFSYGTFAIYFYNFVTNTTITNLNISSILTMLETYGFVTSFIILLVLDKKIISLEDSARKNIVLIEELKSIHRDADYLDRTLYKLVPTVNFEKIFEEKWNNEIFENNHEIFNSNNNINPVIKIWFIRMKLRKELEKRSNNDIMVNHRKMVEKFNAQVLIALMQVMFSDLRIKLALSYFGSMLTYKKFKIQNTKIIFSENMNKISEMIRNNLFIL